MTIESMIVAGLGVAFLCAIAIYADRHRAEDKEKEKGKHHHA
jgi:hypothetical protein